MRVSLLRAFASSRMWLPPFRRGTIPTPIIRFGIAAGKSAKRRGPAVRSAAFSALMLLAMVPVASMRMPALAGVTAIRAANTPAPLSARDRADVQRVETYLNTVKSMSARFQQYAQNGETAEGKVLLSRPGRMRFEYDPPSPILLIATGKLVIYVDNTLKHVTYLPTDSTPAWFLLRDRITLEGDVTVTNFERGPDALRITVVETSHPDNGSLTMTFSDHPLELKQWTVLDQQGKRTTVVLSDPHYNISLDPHLFMFVDPWPRKE
jgi:outer membrane lipoprotein-sorting protein